MNRILQLQQDRQAKIEAAKAILAAAEKDSNRALSADELAAFDSHTQAAESISATLDREQRMASLSNIPGDQRGSVQVHDNWTDNPYLFGRAPAQNETKEERRRRVAQGFGEQLFQVRKAAMIQNSAAGGEIDKRLFELQRRADLQKRAPSGSSESIAEDGGFLIQPDMANEVLVLAHDVGQVYQRVDKLPLSEATNAIKIPAVNETSRADGSRFGGIQMFWENEAASLVGSKPSFRLIELVTKKLTGLYYATSEVLNDARLLGALAMKGFGEEMAFKLDDGVIRGTGAGQLRGILNANALVSVSKETGQAAATIVYENIKKMWGRMWSRSRQNAVWFINQDCEQQLYGMVQVVGTAGAPVYLPPGGASSQPYAMLFGRPVIPIEQCSTLGTIGDIILADFGEYVFVDKGDMQTAASMHVRFIFDEQVYRYIYRCDGDSKWAVPLTPAHGSNTLSPFIALQTRS